jgi:uncharacterized protein (TIGR03000 family)
MYSIALLMALSGGSEVADGHRHGGGCCGEVASCGCRGGHERHHRHHRHGGCCGEVASCGCCGYVPPVACGCCGAPGAPPAAHPEGIKAMPKTGMVAAPATIVVELPADATLKVDGSATSSTSGVRVLVSPELPVGQEFHYTLTALATRDGKSVQVEKTVLVRAGEESRISLSLPLASVAQR